MNKNEKRGGSNKLISIGVVIAGTIILAISTPSPLSESRFYEQLRILNERLENADNVTLPAKNPGNRLASSTELEHAVIRAARQHRLHPALLYAVMKAESSFNPLVVSKAGAVGLMQLVPETAMRHGVRNLYDTNENVAGGARHLRYLLDRFHGNTRLALAAYNAGEGKVDRYKQIPPYKETRHYVQRVLNYYRDYRKEVSVAVIVEGPSEGYTMRTL
jgi:soluble lytic murein transglycosylase-like protein